MGFNVQFTDLGDERQEGADGDAGETNEVGSGKNQSRRVERRVCSCLCPLELSIVVCSRGHCEGAWLPLPSPSYGLW